MGRMITVSTEKCTNCRMCEAACSFTKAGVFAPTRSRIKVHAFPEDFRHIPTTCFQCADAPCARVCPSGALVQGDGLVRYLPDSCIGCRMCMLACPFGVISFEAEQGKIAKCDTCDGDPECVRFCAYGALEFRESDLASAARGRDFARKVAEASRKS